MKFNIFRPKSNSLHNLLQFTFMVVISGFLSRLFPFWIILPATAIVAFLFNKSAFATGFLAIGFLWLSYAIWLDQQNQQILSRQIALLFQLPEYMDKFIFVITGFMGAFLGGIGAATGRSFRRLFERY
ncbi:hypothetical protein [Persicobacter sp. CCB-QB2]|uniref:hypothetical protein n=1 Tax=Persicobacter sp. CCB-QB2 TaxID=1561025 RepID=UPI0006A9C632|nr:hypothetical protein [Persicobacter sp. CCB-QB2]